MLKSRQAAEEKCGCVRQDLFSDIPNWQSQGTSSTEGCFEVEDFLSPDSSEVGVCLVENCDGTELCQFELLASAPVMQARQLKRVWGQSLSGNVTLVRKRVEYESEVRQFSPVLLLQLSKSQVWTILPESKTTK